MNAIAGILARAKAAAAPRIELASVRRVRPIDGSCAPGYVIDEEDGWVYWRGDDGYLHCSRPEYLQ